MKSYENIPPEEKKYPVESSPFNYQLLAQFRVATLIRTPAARASKQKKLSRAMRNTPDPIQVAVVRAARKEERSRRRRVWLSTAVGDPSSRRIARDD